MFISCCNQPLLAVGEPIWWLDLEARTVAAALLRLVGRERPDEQLAPGVRPGLRLLGRVGMALVVLVRSSALAALFLAVIASSAEMSASAAAVASSSARARCRSARTS